MTLISWESLNSVYIKAINKLDNEKCQVNS